MEFLLLPAVAPFAAALVGLAFIGVIELLGLMVAGVAGLTHALDSLVDIDAVPESFATDWLLVRGMPLMVTVAAALLGFGVTGVVTQGFIVSRGIEPMPLAAAGSLGIVGALGLVRALGALLSHAKLEGDTSAVSRESLVGRKAQLMSPVARLGYAGEASVKDEHGATHYVMVEPEAADIEITSKQEFELVALDGHIYRARLLK